MTGKLSYEELQQRIKELEKEAVEHKRAKEELQTILDAVPVIIFQKDRDGKTIRTNQAFDNMTGLSKKEIIGKTTDELFPEYGKDMMKDDQEVMELGKPKLDIIEHYDTPEGTRWARTGKAPLKDKKGNVVGLIGYAADITEQKQIEEALRISEAQKKAILDASIDRIRLVDKDMRIIWANKTTTRELNISPEDLAGQLCYKAFVGKDSPCTECPTKKALKSGNIEHTILHQPYSKGIEGETYWDTYTVPLKNESGDIVNCIQVARNITNSKKAEEALRESEERLKNILDSLQAGIVLIDPVTHTIVDANPAAIEMIGTPKEQIIGHVCHEYICPAEKGKCPITDLGQEVDNSERTLLTANGKEIPILKTVTPILLSGQAHLLDIFIDITEKKELEAQLQQAQKMEAIGTLAGGIAHNFNNILMGIEGYVSLMLMDIHPTHPHRKTLEGIEEQIQGGAELTKQLLGFARGGKYEIIATNLNELIKTQNRMFGKTKKEITFREKYEENLWTVEVDQGQIEQVLLNLYVNAWQAMPRGGDLYIQTENVILNEDYTSLFNVDPGGYVKISVTDTGVGMDEETQRRIFEPFFTTKEMGRGTGLGLSSAYGIIKNHDGIINVNSNKGEGTTFSIYLPVLEKEVIKKEELHEEILKGKETVLLVDDEDVITDVGEDILKTLGYKALIARSGKEAIEIYKKNKDTIDIVILDMIMPGIGGGETYDRVKEINLDIKVLLSSGYSINGEATEILKRGCNGFIQKPFNMKQLAEKIRDILDS